MTPYGIHSIMNIYSPNAVAATPEGWAAAVGLPYHGTLFERLRAAWWVVTGRAHALVWPEVGDIERALPPSSPFGSNEPPSWFVKDFLQDRRFYAARNIDIVARKDGKECRLEGDWLKPFVASLAKARGQAA